MPLSSIQQGLIVQDEYAKFLMMGSGGRIELAAPMSDDERRDYEIHVRGHYGLGLASQVKSAMSLQEMSKNVRYLYIPFDVRANRLVSSPFYWYFFAYLDPKLMGLADPTFLIPSKDFHEMAAPRLRNGVWYFTMAASMEPKSRDKWHRYRVRTIDLGPRVLEILADLQKSHGARLPPSELLRMPCVVVLGQRR
jgi:hypothetical protein